MAFSPHRPFGKVLCCVGEESLCEAADDANQPDTGGQAENGVGPLHNVIANGSLTLLAVGSDDTESRWSGGEDGVGEQEIGASVRRRATALPASEGPSAWALHAARSARISLPDHQYVAGWIGAAGARHRQCRRPGDRLSRPH